MAVGVGRAEERREVAVVGGERLGHGGQERQVLLDVVADRELVVGLVEAVELAVVVLDAAAAEGVVGVLEAAALEIRREGMRRMELAVVVGGAQTRLAP